MTQLVSHLDLLIAVSPMLAAGFLACGAGFLYIAWEKRARRRATEEESRAAESRKAAHA